MAYRKEAWCHVLSVIYGVCVMRGGSGELRGMTRACESSGES